MQTEKIFGENLSDILFDRDIKRKDFAEQLNITYSTICNYCQGTRFPDIDTLLKICKTLNVPVEEMCGVKIVNHKYCVLCGARMDGENNGR